MKNIINTACTFAFILCFKTVWADGRIFLNEQFEPVSETEGSYYGEPAGTKDGLYALKVHYMSGGVRMTGQYTEPEYHTEEGYFEYFHFNGKTESSGNYSKGQKVGIWERFTWDGSKKSDRIYNGEYGAITENTSSMIPAEFPGGEAAMFAHIAANVRPMTGWVPAGRSQSVYIGFGINEKGEVIEAYIYKSVNEALDAEAIRIAETLPDWKPATQNGVPLRSGFILPVTFSGK